jgi:hypothetical protein
MVEKRKFAALAELHRQPSEPEAPAAAIVSMSVPEKGSNPEWKLYSHFLKRQTQRAAVARLQAEDSGRDLSDVLQELLENWLKS